jgi:hypothetical protein
VDRIEYPAGDGQKIVVYVTEDVGQPLDPLGIFATVASDSAEEALAGWRIVSTAVLPLRQMGTAGNIFFQSGGQFATRAGLAVFYGKA